MASNLMRPDVLAVLESVMRDMPTSMTRRGHHGDLSEAWAAVAELIKAAEHLRSCDGDEGADPGSVASMRLDAAKDRVDAAITRCHGDQP